MSRSNPHENGTPNPSTRWFEWSGETGIVRYWDKEKEERIEVGSDFTFILLDRLSTVGGFHEPSESRIYANEVRDTRSDVLVVRSFKGGTLIEGFYKDIKDRLHTLGGHFVTTCYIAFKNGGGQLAIGAIRFKGAALGAWMDFEKEHRAELFKKAIRINGYSEGKKGRIVFRMPTFSLLDISKETDADAVALDKQLQDYLAGYLKKNKRDQAETASTHVRDEDVMDPDDPPPMEPITDDDIPF